MSAPIKLDGVNSDGVSGWELYADGGVLMRSDWHCDYVDSVHRPATREDLDALLESPDREWPDSLPHHGAYRDRAAMADWDRYLRAIFDGHHTAAPAWWREVQS